MSPVAPPTTFYRAIDRSCRRRTMSARESCRVVAFVRLIVFLREIGIGFDKRVKSCSLFSPEQAVDVLASLHPSTRFLRRTRGT